MFAVWGYVIANTADSQVELNPKMLAAAIGCEPERIERAIAFLCAPDPNSRSKTEDGRRLIREGEFAYRVPNFAAYRAIRNEDERRAYNREKKREQRVRERTDDGVKAPVNDSQEMSNHASASASTSQSASGGVVRSSARVREALPELARSAFDALAGDRPDAVANCLQSAHEPLTGGARYSWEAIGQALIDYRSRKGGDEFVPVRFKRFLENNASAAIPNGRTKHADTDAEIRRGVENLQALRGMGGANGE